MNWTTVKILLLLLLFTTIGLASLSWKIDAIKERIVVNEAVIHSLLSKNIELNQDITLLRTEFELFKKLTSDEFENTWKSFSHIRDNFISIGYTLEYGLHLKDEDKPEPEK